MNSNKHFQILSLDGGGIKGIFSAAVLARIEDDANTKIINHFDLITGTSTGGIIALGLGMGMRPREIVEFYISLGSRIFPRRMGLNKIQHWLYRKYSSTPLKESLQKCFQGKKLGDSTKRLVIPSYNIGEDDVYLFRTPHHKKLKRDYKVEAWKVAMSTSAAPTFLSSCHYVDSLRLIDGGVWANNPIMLGIAEAHHTLGIPLKSIKVFSIGTSDEVSHRSRFLDSGGILAWLFQNTAIEIITRGQNISALNHAKLLLGDDKIVRLNPKVPKGIFSLHGTQRADDLIGKAAHYSRHIVPVFEKDFMSHVAPKYIPSFIIKDPLC